MFANFKADGLTKEVQYNIYDFGPWWWLPTEKCLITMCETLGMKFVEGGNSICNMIYTGVFRNKNAK